ncbi:MAG: hypothetical protein R3E53_13460 [Myxococcota bacterium]
MIFFLHTCPHCHGGPRRSRTSTSLPADKRPRLVAVSIQNAPTGHPSLASPSSGSTT